MNSPKPALWRRVFSFPALLGVLLSAAGFVATSWGGVAGGKCLAEDPWFHVVIGRAILATHAWPHADTYSLTAGGTSWIAYEWLGQAPMGLVWNLGGTRGLAGLLVFWVVLFVLLLYAFAFLRTRNSKASSAAAAVCLTVLGSSLTIRPQLPGFCFLLLTLILLELALRGRTWVLALLPPLFMIWVNTHSSFILGFVVIAVYAFEGRFEFRRYRITAERWPPELGQKIGWSVLASVAALLVTPYGGKIAAYPLDYMLHQRLNIASNTEWRSVLEIHSAAAFAFFALLALFVAANFFLRSMVYPLRDLAFLAGVTVEAFMHVRMLAVFAVAFAPVAAAVFARFTPPYEPQKDRPALNAILIAGVLAACAASFPSRAQLEHLLEEKFPVGNVAYLRDHPALEPVFNRAEWGGYMMQSGLPVFMNGQLDIFEFSGTLADYLRIVQPMPDAEALLRKYAIRACLLETHSRLAQELERRPGWRVVSSDQISVLIEYDAGQAAATRERSVSKL